MKAGKQIVDTTTVASTPARPHPITPTKSTTKPTTKPTAARSQTTGGVVRKMTEDIGGQRTSKTKEIKTPAPEGALKESYGARTAIKEKSVPAEASPQAKTVAEPKEVAKDVTPSPASTPASKKRQHPGKLDITAATTAPEVAQSPLASKTEIHAKNIRTLTAPKSVPSSPAAANSGSPIKRVTAPRTLRVVPTPKTEVPPPLATPSASSVPHISAMEKLRSRQASIASINLPGTPSSDLYSDNASVTSTSISRASSPPPIGGKVGTAPVRIKTKSQAKKDRQERKRQIEEDQAIEEDKSDIEVVHAPILGRKKKAKKPTVLPKPMSITGKGQPASPAPATNDDTISEPATPTSKPIQSNISSTRATPDPEYNPEQELKREHTAQSIMTDLQRTGEIRTSTLEFFKPLSSTLTHASRTAPSSNISGPPDLKIHFSEADLDALAKKKPVRLSGTDGKADSRTLITPHGKFFWGLSEELEEKALELENQIEQLKGHTRFHPRRQSSHLHAHNAPTQSQSQDVLPAIATALKEAGKKLGNNNTQQMPKLDPSSNLLPANVPLPPVQSQEAQQPPPPPQAQTPADAGAYLNQFVLPRTDNPPPNQPRPEMAAVGGPPGAGTANISVHAGKFAKAAKAVVEGGAVGSTEIDGMGMMAADLLGGVFVQGLEALVGAGLGFQSTQEFGLDANGNITLRGGGGGGGLDVQGLMNAIDGFGGGGSGSRYGRGSVMSLDEAERALHAARKEHDVLEKKLAGLMKKNKKLFAGVGRV
jgi:CCR4-NOT transcription complex subunit 4